MTVTFYNNWFSGLSSDTKPVKDPRSVHALEVGWWFFESDTGRRFWWNGTTWLQNAAIYTTGSTSTFFRADGTWAVPPGGSGGINTLKTTADQIINGTGFQDITGLTFAVSANTDYAFDFYITFRSTTATGFRFSVNGPAGTVDYMRKYQTITNSDLVGVATWLEGHAVSFDAMTVTTATIAAGVDLHCRITGRFKCGGAGGTFAARAASESANNDLVVQKGSWGTWF